MKNEYIPKHTDTKVLYLGNFNLLKVRWQSDAGDVCPSLGPIESEFISFLSYLNLRQFNHVKNPKPNYFGFCPF